MVGILRHAASYALPPIMPCFQVPPLDSAAEPPRHAVTIAALQPCRHATPRCQLLQLRYATPCRHAAVTPHVAASACRRLRYCRYALLIILSLYFSLYAATKSYASELPCY